MKCIYVLTCSDNDFYYEQFLLSVYSLRFFNPDLEIVVLIDKKTASNLVGKKRLYEEMVTETKVIDTNPELTQKEASRWIKTSIGAIIFDDFLFIDCDTIICDRLDFSFSEDIIIGAVLDTHVPLSQHYLKTIFQEDNKKLGFSCPFESDLYFNGGLLYCRNHETTRIFFQKWHELWNTSRKLGNSQDMPSLNQANFELGNPIKELDGVFNCQISHNGLPFLHHAKIIHYYATSLVSFAHPYKLASSKVFYEIKEKGVISTDISLLLQNPLSAFEQNTRIISDKNALDVIDSSLFYKLLWLRNRHKSLFMALDAMTASLTRKVKRLFKYTKKDLKNNF